MKSDKTLLSLLEGYDKYNQIRDNLIRGDGSVAVFGLPEAHRAHMLSALHKSTGRSILLVCANEADCVKAEEALEVYGVNCMHFPAKTQLVSSNAIAVSGGTENQRIACLVELMRGKKTIVTVSAECLMQKLAPRDALMRTVIQLKVGMERDMTELVNTLASTGYERAEMCTEVCTFTVRGGRIDVFPSNGRYPIRIEFFGDEIDSIRTFDPEEQRSIEEIDEFTVYPATEVPAEAARIKNVITRLRRMKNGRVAADELERTPTPYLLNQVLGLLYEETSYISDYLPADAICVLNEPLRITESADNEFSLYTDNVRTIIDTGAGGEYLWHIMSSPQEAVGSLPQERTMILSSFVTRVPGIEPKSVYQIDAPIVTTYQNSDDILSHDLTSYLENGYTVLILAGKSRDGVEEVLRECEIPYTLCDKLSDADKIGAGILLTRDELPCGFEYREIRLTVITRNELFGISSHRRKGQYRTTARRKTSERLDLSTLTQGDFVVHESHGIGRYIGVNEVIVNGSKCDYVNIEFAGGDIVSVNCGNLDCLQKYVGTDEVAPKLSRVGSKAWENTLTRVRSNVKKLAIDLVKLYGERMSKKGYVYEADTPQQIMLEESFPYDETPDQLTSLAEIKRDMEKGVVMDRLLCGDVGFGKTEVALRIAFKAVMNLKQVAFLVPTTILAHQHYNTLKSRFDNFGIRVDFVSRFKSSKEIKETLERLADGRIDVIIGTHRLLSKDVKFYDLGLLIIDEEQRFGVGHKEKIKEMKKNVDVLTMTATPIPRTMHMSLIGIRDISLLDTPPKQRYPVQTFVAEQSPVLIRDAVLKETARDGQVFILYNNVQMMDDFYTGMCELLPDVRIGMAHGQMNEGELEKTMLDFIDRRFDVLIASTIIENGLDVPNANTLIVINADRLGLAQMYQLRGRVGRSNRIGFAYFTFPKGKVLSEVAAKRLSSIAQYTQLGSGYKIAMKDLQIRGAGNLLGAEQSGHMAAIGYEMYCRLVSEAISEVQGKTAHKKLPVTRVDVTIDAYIPKTYIESEENRLEIYERIADIRSEEDYADTIDELIDRYGEPPKPVMNLLTVALIRTYTDKCYIKTVAIRDRDVTLVFDEGAPYNIDKFMAFLRKHNAAISGAGGTVVKIPETDADKARVCASVKPLCIELMECLEDEDNDE